MVFTKRVVPFSKSYFDEVVVVQTGSCGILVRVEAVFSVELFDLSSGLEFMGRIELVWLIQVGVRTEI